MTVGSDDRRDSEPKQGDTRARGESVPNLRIVSPDSYPDWESIYLDNVERLYRLMYRKVGNRPDAEDLTAEVFQAALVPLRVGASIGEVRSYLLATAQTVLASHWRNKYGIEVTAIDENIDRPFLDNPSPDSDAPQRVTRILAALPDRYSRILRLRFLEAHSLQEAAAAMDISIGNAKVLQHRALRKAAEVAGELV